MSRRNVIFATVVVCGLAFAGWRLLSALWPVYNYDVRLPSPDGRYVIYVLEGDKAAFDDFFYRVYVFPGQISPQETAKGKRMLMEGIWRDRRYLIYQGYAVPALRWISSHEIQIDLDDLYDQVDDFRPVPNIDGSRGDRSKAVLVSLAFNGSDVRDLVP